ncbi:MAG: hypothetical protein PF488_01930 [Patescibacteria group bacterium]|jgi:hypothetical protein|nr:hypothetical protein [Patescibacteria group bacterium]
MHTQVFSLKDGKMKKFLIIFLIGITTLSCKKEMTRINNTELWLKVDSSIEELDISFIGIDKKDRDCPYDIKYLNGIYTPNSIKKIHGDGPEPWELIHVSQNYSEEIVVTYKNKDYKTRGFYLGERRFMEIIIPLSGEIVIQEVDISMIDRLIYVE